MKNFLAALIHVLKDIHMTQEDTLAAIARADAKVTKIAADQTVLLGKVADLTAALAAAGNPSTPEIDAALTALNDHLTAVDDAVPDETPAPDAQP